jgi:xanthine/uracil/vitamin C permease (AzgA family)
MRRCVWVVALAGAIVLVGDVAPAVAATSDIGKHLGDEIKSWATVLLLGVAGLVAIPVLFKRDVNGGIVLALLVVLVGGFAFAPDSVKHAIESLWKSIAG